MEFDVVIVGAGPAGLAAAIRLKQRAPELSVVVLEKGSEVGAHILSGAVHRPDRPRPAAARLAGRRGLPGQDAGHARTASCWLGPDGALRLPDFLMPPLMRNHGNFIVSLGDVCRWLGTKAEALGVEIFPGFAAVETLHDDDRRGRGRRHRRHGGRPRRHAESRLPARHGAPGEVHADRRGRARLARQDGSSPASVSPAAASRRNTASASRSCGRSTRRSTARAWCSTRFGWPLDNRTGGGSFLYHFGDNLVSVGFVVHLNYANPHLSPFEEFQRFKTHPADPRRCSKAASASPMAPGRSPRAAGSRCRSSSSPAGR